MRMGPGRAGSELHHNRDLRLVLEQWRLHPSIARNWIRRRLGWPIRMAGHRKNESVFQFLLEMRGLRWIAHRPRNRGHLLYADRREGSWLGRRAHAHSNLGQYLADCCEQFQGGDVWIKVAFYVRRDRVRGQ